MAWADDRMALIRRRGWRPKSSTPLHRFAPFKSSEFQAVQSQCVADHRHGAKSHGDAGDHWTQKHAEERIEHTGRDRDTEHIVDERKEKVLPDVTHGAAAQVARLGDAAQIAF